MHAAESATTDVAATRKPQSERAGAMESRYRNGPSSTLEGRSRKIPVGERGVLFPRDHISAGTETDQFILGGVLRLVRQISLERKRQDPREARHSNLG